MKRNDYVFYSDYLKNRNLIDGKILVAKTDKSYLIGPIINSDFDEISFYKRIKSNSIYSIKIYKKTHNKKIINLIDEYIKKLKSNQVIEVYKKGGYLIHKIIKVPGE